MFDAFAAQPEIWARAAHGARKSLFRDTMLVLVEGGSDRDMYSSFFEPRSTSLFVFHGRSGVLTAARTLCGLSDSLFAGIVDADCDHLTRDYGATSGLPVARTDTHDSETLILLSDHCITRTVNRFTSQEWQAAQGGVSAIVDRALEAARPVGLVKYLQDCRSLFLQASVNPRKLEYREFIADDMNCDVSAFVAYLASQYSRLDAELLNSTLQVELANAYDRWLLCRGHDVAAILAIGFSSGGGAHVGVSEVERELRTAYSQAEDFLGTVLCRELRRLRPELRVASPATGRAAHLAEATLTQSQTPIAVHVNSQ